MHSDPLLQILILLAASVCVVAAVRKLALPAILGYLAVGMLLGPHALALAADNETTRLLADFGVVFLVFTLGLEFSLPRLVAMRWEVLGVGGAQVLTTTAVVAAVAVCSFDIAPAVAVVDRRRGGDVLDGHHHRAADRAVGEQPHARPSGRGHLPVSGPELSAVARPGVGADRRRPERARPRTSPPPSASPRWRCCWCSPPGRWLLRPLFLVDRLGALRGAVFARGVARGAGLGLGDQAAGCRSRSARSSPA